MNFCSKTLIYLLSVISFSSWPPKKSKKKMTLSKAKGDEKTDSLKEREDHFILMGTFSFWCIRHKSLQSFCNAMIGKCKLAKSSFTEMTSHILEAHSAQNSWYYYYFCEKSRLQKHQENFGISWWHFDMPIQWNNHLLS